MRWRSKWSIHMVQCPLFCHESDVYHIPIISCAVDQLTRVAVSNTDQQPCIHCNHRHCRIFIHSWNRKNKMSDLWANMELHSGHVLFVNTLSVLLKLSQQLVVNANALWLPKCFSLLASTFIILWRRYSLSQRVSQYIHSHLHLIIIQALSQVTRYNAIWVRVPWLKDWAPFP